MYDRRSYIPRLATNKARQAWKQKLEEITLVCLNFLWKKELESYVRNEDVAVKKNTERENHLPKPGSS